MLKGHHGVLNIYVVFNPAGFSPNQPLLYTGCGTERRWLGAADWSQSAEGRVAGGETSVSFKTNRGLEFVLSTAHQLMAWPDFHRSNDS